MAESPLFLHFVHEISIASIFLCLHPIQDYPKLQQQKGLRQSTKKLVKN